MLARVVWITAQLMRFKAGPQDFVYARGLSLPIALFAAFVNFLQLNITTPTGAALIESVVVVLVTIAFTQLVLQFKRFTSRAQQTVNSLLCTDIVFKLLLLPVLFWIGPDVLRQFSENPQMLEQGQVPAAPMMVLFALSLWNLAVSAHIYRCALEIGIFMGVGITLAGTFMLYSLLGAVAQVLGLGASSP